MKHLNCSKSQISVLSAVLSAILYAICIPCAKIIGNHISGAMLGAFLYLGAGFGLLLISSFGNKAEKKPLTKKELPFVIAMILLDISAIIFLMFGISLTTSANVSLLGNFELVSTSLAAFFVFREFITMKITFAIVLITLASITLSFEGNGSFVFNLGSIFVILSCLCWGFENNCTRVISSKDTRQITIIKGCFSGLGSLIIAFMIGETLPSYKWILVSLLLGFISYGISVCLYIYAQRCLGAAKTGALYSIAPFVGVLFSMILLGERPQLQFYIALVAMIIASILVIKDSFETQDS